MPHIANLSLGSRWRLPPERKRWPWYLAWVSWKVHFTRGGGAAFGIVFAPNDMVGIYSTFSAMVGILGSASLQGSITVMKGGIGDFCGECQADTSEGGPPGTSNSLSLLLDLKSKRVIGVTGAIGLGIGLPIGAYSQYQGTRAGVYRHKRK